MSKKWTVQGKRNLLFLFVVSLLIGVNIVDWVISRKLSNRVQVMEEQILRGDTNDVNLARVINNVIFDVGSIMSFYEQELGVSREDGLVFINTKREEEKVRKGLEDKLKKEKQMSEQELDVEIRRLEELKSKIGAVSQGEEEK